MLTKRKKVLIGFLNGIIPVVLAFALGSVFISVAGHNPLQVYGLIVKEAFLDKKGFINTLAYGTPIIITALAACIAYNANVYNFGTEGQLYCGAFLAAFLGFTLSGLPHIVHVTICLLGGIAGGMAYALIPALLKSLLRINEVVTTIMLNSVAIIVTTYLTNGPFNAHVGYSATDPVAESAQFSRLYPGARLTTSFFMMLLLVVAVHIVLSKTKLGYEIRALGSNSEFSDAMGMRVYKKYILLFLISGGISGLAGASEIMGVNYRFTPSFSTNPGLGWDGVQIALLARNNPILSLVVGIIYGGFKYGGVVLQSQLGLSNDVINIIQSSMILFLAVRYVDEKTGFLRKLFKGNAKKQEAVK